MFERCVHRGPAKIPGLLLKTGKHGKVLSDYSAIEGGMQPSLVNTTVEEPDESEDADAKSAEYREEDDDSEKSLDDIINTYSG